MFHSFKLHKHVKLEKKKTQSVYSFFFSFTANSFSCCKILISLTINLLLKLYIVRGLPRAGQIGVSFN